MPRSAKKYTAAEIIEVFKETDESLIEVVTDRDKNADFIFYYNLSHEDIIEILDCLDAKHFDSIEACNDKNYDVDFWYRFIMPFSLPNIDGLDDYVDIFIRLGIQNGKFKIIVRSFHDDDFFKKR